MAQQLVPRLIYDHFSQDTFFGSFEAVTLFIDMSGFTPLTETLLQHRRDGAEALSQALYSVFAPCVREVYARGGFISTYAGDAFTAIFPRQANDSVALQAITTAFFMQAFFAEQGKIQTPYGDFQLSVKIGLGSGRVDWGILGSEGQHTYYFRGAGIDACAFAEHQADKGEIIASVSLLSEIRSYVTHETRGDDYALLTEFAGESPATRPPVALLTADEQRPFAPDVIIDTDIRGEFRDVSVAFISIDDPQDDHLIHSFIEQTLLLVNRYGGFFRHVDFGDKGAVIVLVFGAPIAHENNIERAADCLLALRNFETSVRWRAGMTFGTSYAGFTGGEARSDYSAVGDVVNLAARLCMQANWGDIWTTARVQTWLASNDFQFVSLGAKSFKGKTQVVEVFSFLGRQSTSLIDTQTVAMIGRKSELDTLLGAAAPIFEHQYAGIAYVYGEAGLGKSQLALALRQQVQAQHNVDWIYLPADEILRVSYNPLRHFLRQYFDQRVGDSQEANRSRFDERLDQLIQSPDLASESAQPIRAALERTRTFLGALIDLRWAGSFYELVEPSQRAENTQIALKNLLLAESLRHPLILHFEDIHWLDNDTITLVVGLTRNMTDFPIFLLMTSRYRDDGTKVEIPGLDPTIPQQVIELEPFTDDDMASQVDAILSGAADPTFISYLSEKTEGNPFFIEQLVYHLLELNVLEVYNDVWRMREAQLNEVPTTIGAVLIARLDRLTQEVKQVVQTAAVLGQEFEINVLSAMLRNDPHVSSKVKEAEDQSIWTAITRILYLFKHALMRDAAYDMQLRARLRELHALAATAILDVYTDDLPSHYGDLAYHFSKAGDLDREREYSLLAGRAAAEGATADAANFLARAYELTPEDQLQERYEILELREKIYDLQAERATQREVIDAMLSISEQLKDQHKYGRSLVRLGALYETIGEFEKVYESLDKAEEIAKELHDLEMHALSIQARSSSLTRQGRLNETIPNISLAADLFSQIGDTGGQCRMLNALSVHYINTGNFDEAMKVLNQSMQLAQEINDELINGKVLQNLGIIAIYTGKYEDGLRHLTEAYEVMVKYGDRRNQAACIVNRGTVSYGIGDYDAAYRDFLEAHHHFREVGDLIHMTHVSHNLGAIAIQRNDYEDAIAQLEEGIQLSDQVKNIASMGQMNDALGNVYLILGQYENARGVLVNALDLVRKTQNRRIELHTLGAFALLNIDEGDFASAVEFANLNINGALDSNFPQVAAIGYRMKGRALLEMGDPVGSKEAYQQALQIEQESNEIHLLPEDWTGLARAAMAEGKLDEALAYVESSLEVISDNPELAGTTETFLIYLTCYDALVAVGQNERAGALVNQAYDVLQARAIKLKNPVNKESYLNNVAAHRRLIDLWEAQNQA